MSLISVQNFLAPFRSKTHLVTLIIVAAVFGAFRLSGGSVVTVSRTQRKAPSYSIQNTPPSTRHLPNDVESYDTLPPSYQALPKSQSKSDSILDTLNEDNGSTKSSSKAKEELSDIERKLGLR